MADQQYQLRTPTNRLILGTNEMMPVRYPISAWPGPNGEIQWDYTGGASTEFDEGAEIVVVDGELTFLCEDGNDWKLSELSLHPVNDSAG